MLLFLSSPSLFLSPSPSPSPSPSICVSHSVLSFGNCPEAHALVVQSAEEKRSNINRNLVGFQVASSIDRNCCGSYKGISILHTLCLHTKGWFFFPNLMDVMTGNSHSSEKQPVESCKSLEEGKEAVGKDPNNSLFVNHAALAWHESRQKWVGDQTQRSPKRVKDEIISWSTTYEELLSTNEPFSEPIPLPEMVDFLVDIWHSEGLFD